MVTAAHENLGRRRTFGNAGSLLGSPRLALLRAKPLVRL